MPSRSMYLPLLERLPQDAVTQRLCAAWFARFPLDTLLLLREAPPEAFDMIIGQIVRAELKRRRRFLIPVQVLAFFMSANTALNLAIGNWWALPFVAVGWCFHIRSLRMLAPERCTPPFILRIREWQVTAESDP